MKFNLTDIYHLAFGKKARPFDENCDTRNYQDFIYSSIIASAYCSTQAEDYLNNNGIINVDNISFIHLLLYYMDQSGIGLDSFYDIIKSSEYFDNLQNIDKYLYKNYCTDKLFKSIKDEDMWSKYFNADEYCDDLKFVPTHFMLKTWAMNDLINGLLRYLNYNDNTFNKELIELLESAYLLQANMETDYDNWAQDEIINRGLDPYDILSASDDMLSDIDMKLYNQVRNMYNSRAKKNASKTNKENRETYDKKPNNPIDNKLKRMYSTDKLQEQSNNLVAKVSQRIDKRTKIQNIVNLSSYVVGQDEAIKIIADKILGAFVGFHGDKEPVASFLLTGPTGVGKTETAKAVADLCCNGHIHVVDMSTFKSKIDISRLIGASPNYVGYGDKIPFVDFIKEHPDGVILFDEGEKAHPECLDAIMRILDEAEFITARGEKLSLKENIIFFTSNYTANTMRLGFNSDNGSTEEKITTGDGGIRKEIIGRFNNVIEYKPLKQDACKQIARNFIDKKIAIFKSNNSDLNINLEYTDDLLDAIVRDANTNLLGARDLKKLIDKYFVAVVSQYIVKHNPSDCALVVTSDGVSTPNSSNVSTEDVSENTDDNDPN